MSDLGIAEYPNVYELLNLAGKYWGRRHKREMSKLFALIDISQVGTDLHKVVSELFTANRYNDSVNYSVKLDIKHSKFSQDYLNGCGGYRTRFESRMPTNRVPSTMQGQGALWRLGLDYFILKDGYMDSYVEPTPLFPDGIGITGVSKEKEPMSQIACSWAGYDSLGPGVIFLLRYLRGEHNEATLESALSAVAGYTPLLKCSVLELVVEMNDETLYIFRDQVILDSEPRDLKVQEGDTIPEGWVPNRPVRVFCPRPNTTVDQQWWKRCRWSYGLRLEELGGPSGVIAQNKTVMATVRSQDSDGTLHAQVDLLGDPTKLDTFWDSVAARERSSGINIANALGLRSINDSVWVNPIDFLFTYIYSRNTTILEVTLTSKASRSSVCAVARNLVPLGHNLIINTFPTTELTSESSILTNPGIEEGSWTAGVREVEDITTWYEDATFAPSSSVVTDEEDLTMTIADRTASSY